MDGSCKSTVEGGNANDYDYAMADPCNNYDLDGRHVQKYPGGDMHRYRWLPSKLKILGCGKALSRFNRFHKVMQHRFAHLDSRGKLENSKYWTPDAQFILLKNSGYGGDVTYFCGQGALSQYR